MSMTGRLRGVLKAVGASGSMPGGERPDTPPSPSEPFSLTDLDATQVQPCLTEELGALPLKLAELQTGLALSEQCCCCFLE